MTVPVNPAVTRRRIVDPEKSVPKETVFATLALSAPLLAVRILMSARMLSATPLLLVPMFPAPLSVFAPLAWLGIHM